LVGAALGALELELDPGAESGVGFEAPPSFIR
jgi:hypothetical protein